MDSFKCLCHLIDQNLAGKKHKNPIKNEGLKNFGYRNTIWPAKHIFGQAYSIGKC